MPVYVPLSFCPVYERSKMFAYDFVYFLAEEYETNWVPHSTFIHPLFSSLTSDIEDGAIAFLRNREHIFMIKYEALIPQGTSGHGGIFYGHAVQTFELFFSRIGAPEDFFKMMVYVARLGILFYQRGVLEAPDDAAHLIATFLYYYMQSGVGPGVLSLFRLIGRDLARRT